MDKIEPSDQSERKSYRLFSPPAGETDDSERKGAWKGDSFSFHDFLDVINPLQHLPVVSTLYRWITGDAIGAVPRMVGDALYGGPIGFVTGLINAEVKQESGKDVGEQVIALLGGDTSAPAADAKTIAAKDAPAAPAMPASDAATAAGATAPPAAAPGAIAGANSGTMPGAIPAAVAALAGTAAASGTPAAAPVSAAAAGPHPIPAMGAASDPSDPRAIFLTRTSMLHRQVAGDSGSLPGRALNNKVVPLQGIAMPAGLLRANAPGAGIGAARPAATDESGAVPAAQGLPSNPPITISQQMMDALEKYTRLQQQRESKPESGRGAQVDLSQ
jgi:hypothetical protein